MKKTIISPETHLQSLSLASRHHAQPRISCGPQIGPWMCYTYMNLYDSDSTCYYSKKTKEARLLKTTTVGEFEMNSVLFSFELSSFWILSNFWICRNSTLQVPAPRAQVYFNAAGRLLATSRQTLLHCHWANTTRPPGPSFQRFHRNPG